ncbi:GNAT family N-acetyltransferase [Arthrobacter sp. VKM Ac-2550]|uniref:GNAT family N-acetyltransferase n=1 Tax=Crystallibacter permensis TaxID=1938888 RepID=UPI0022264B21|nr:N-acetyltransferase [Arthrobacter sp. VKM Ac-2550]MCW2135007.1 putative acetyltransferase, GNAT superfamily [Arthrobacter sp. VKM Ac-2550]
MTPLKEAGDGCGQLPGTKVKPVVRQNQAAEQFEIYLGGHLAGFLRYRLVNGEMRLIETTISREHRIDNLVPCLISHALRVAGLKGLTVLPLSPAVCGFISMHPQYMHLVPVGNHRDTLLQYRPRRHPQR